MQMKIIKNNLISINKLIKKWWYPCRQKRKLTWWEVQKYSIHNVSLLFLVLSWHTASIVSSFFCWSFCNMQKPCTFVFLSSCAIFGAPSPCRLWHIVFQILQVQVNCHSLHWILLHSYVLYLAYSCMTHDKLYMLIWCHLHYSIDNTEQLWMVMFFWFCMNLYLLVCSIASCFFSW